MKRPYPGQTKIGQNTKVAGGQSSGGGRALAEHALCPILRDKKEQKEEERERN